MRHLAILLFLCLISCPESIEAQINYGLKIGMNISNIHLEESEYLSMEFTPRVGINTGIFGEYAANHWFMIQLWMNYDQRGAKFEEDGVESYNSYHMEGKISANHSIRPFERTNWPKSTVWLMPSMLNKLLFSLISLERIE